MNSISSGLRRKLLSVMSTQSKKLETSTPQTTESKIEREEVELEVAERPDFVKDRLIAYLQECQEDNLWLLRQTVMAVDSSVDYSSMELNDLTLTLNEILPNEH